MEQVTLIITSCGRLDLLDKTMTSFRNLNKYPLKDVIINEDDGARWEDDYISFDWHRPPMCIIIQDKRLGLSASLDKLIAEVKTEYVFTCEDDWLFDGNPNFIEDSLKVLEARPDIHHVWVRHVNDHNHPLGIQERINGVLVRGVKKGYLEHWGGFSFNPGLRRVSDIKRFFPNGFAEYGDEIECSKHVEKLGYKAVSLVNTACKHIGWGRHTEGFKV